MFNIIFEIKFTRWIFPLLALVVLGYGSESLDTS